MGEHLKKNQDSPENWREIGDQVKMSKGRATIDIYGLVCDALVSERRKWATLMEAAMQGVLTADRNMREHPQDPAMVSQRTDAENTVTFLLRPDSPYLAMTTSMESTFRTVRAAVEDYHLAHTAWSRTKGAQDRAALVQRVADLQHIMADATLDRSLVAKLFKQAGIPNL